MNTFNSGFLFLCVTQLRNESFHFTSETFPQEHLSKRAFEKLISDE